MKKKIKKIICCMTVLSLIGGSIPNIYAKESNMGENEYIVMSKGKNTINSIKEKYENGKEEDIDLSNKNKITVCKLSKDEKQTVADKQDVVAVEKNFKIKASETNIQIDPDKISDDWNYKMINTDETNRKEFKSKIKVAVIDSGIDECGEINVVKRFNLVPSENDVLPVYDDISGHGTEVASIIANETNNNADIYSIKVMDSDNTAPVSRIIEAIYTAIDENVDVINMSFGSLENSKILHKAIKDAYGKGILLIAAAGNRGEIDGKVEYPAAYNEVMSVGAIDSNGDITENSSVGEDVDVNAPGEFVKTTTNFGLETVSSGTSIAAPHITGMACMLWQMNKEKSADFIRTLIEKSSKTVENEETYKVADLEYALDNYKTYSENYAENKKVIPLNQSDVEADDSMKRVTALWSKANHEALVSNANGGKLTKKQLNLVKTGIRYNDEYLRSNASNMDRKIWHALCREEESNGQKVKVPTDYIAGTCFVQKVIKRSDLNPTNVEKVSGMTQNEYKQMKKDIKNIQWKNVLKIKGLKSEDYPDNKENRRFVLLGMSFHIITDTFAHRAFAKIAQYGRWNGWVYIENVPPYGGEADDIDNFPGRYKAAGNVLKNYIKNSVNGDAIKSIKTIKSRDIIKDNDVLDCAIQELMFFAKNNVANDETYSTWEKKLAMYTYTSNANNRKIIDAIEAKK